jgi:hypothetical protein
MKIAEFITTMGRITGRDPREIELYARRLREAGFFPERSEVRKQPIKPQDAANLLLAIMAADHAAKAPDALQEHRSLTADDDWAGKTLIGFLTNALANAHSDHKLQRFLNLDMGKLSVLRVVPMAILSVPEAAGKQRREIRFRPSYSHNIPESWVEQRVRGTTLVSLSYAIAGLPHPTIAPYLLKGAR